MAAKNNEKRSAVERQAVQARFAGAVDFLDFIELEVFSRRWAALELDDEGDLWELQIAIMRGPEGPPVIEQTGGARKMRFAPSKWSTGKSGGCRVSYVYFQELGIVLLCLVYDKHEKDTVSNSEKKALKTLIERVRKSLRESYGQSDAGNRE